MPSEWLRKYDLNFDCRARTSCETCFADDKCGWIRSKSECVYPPFYQPTDPRDPYYKSNYAITTSMFECKLSKFLFYFVSLFC